MLALRLGRSQLTGPCRAALVLLALAPGGLAQAQESGSGPSTGLAPSAFAFKKPEIAKKAERIYRKITAAGFYPTIRDLAAGTGIGPGLTFWKPHPFGAPVGILGTVGWNPRVLLFEARLGRVPSRPGKIPDRRFTLEALTTDPPEGPNHRWFVFLEARRLDILDNRLYFTPGPGGTIGAAGFDKSTRFLEDSPGALTVHFDVGDDDTDLVAGYHFRRGLAVSARAGYVTAETAFDPKEAATPGLPLIPGVDDTNDFARLRLDFIFDRRDVRNRAHRGVLLHGTWQRMDERGGTLFGFDRFELDARAFLSSRSRRHTVALRFVGTHDQPEKGRVVPFYYQQTLGGNHTLRSYPIFRFRGTRRLAVSAEYRFGLLRFLELAAFYDGGDISGGIEALGSQGYRDSVGASVRWVSKEDVILRVFGAYGSEGWRFSGAGAFPF
ncbi:MAG: outer membrane protein assembly factor [Acidobacteria bacterium]|nr:outer membrane protein assembly factor [Acidobacteriota bacterium]